jgi:hypothetical protein
MKDLFVDRLINISVWQGVARLDFARVDDVNPEDKKVNLSPSYRVAIPLDTLAALPEQSSTTMADLTKRAQSSDVSEANA